MRIIVVANDRFILDCPCGWKSEARATLEAAGRDADLHMAATFPLPSGRRPCPWPLGGGVFIPDLLVPVAWSFGE